MSRLPSPLPWKRNYRKLPPAIEAELAKLAPGALCLVGCEKVVDAAVLAAGTYQHLCLAGVADLPVELRQLLPSPNVGPVSHANAIPEERPLRDRPKYAKLLRGKAPSWRGLGTHRTTFRREVWQRELVPPAMTRIGYRLVPATDGAAPATVRFQVQEVLDPAKPDFGDQLLRCVNLLQENVGQVGLWAVDASAAGALGIGTEDFGWSPLDEASTEAVLARIAQRSAGRGAEVFRLMRERFDCIRKLAPRRILHSTRGFVGYFLIDYCDHLAVFENLEVDNALYVVRANAAELGLLDRPALFARVGEDLERIPHTRGWQQRLDNIVRLARDDQSPRAGEML